MKTENILIRISPQEKQLVKERAEELQMSMSEYIIYLIRMDTRKES